MTIIIIIDRNWNRLGNRITGQNAGFVSSSSSSSLLSSCLMSSSSCGFNCTMYEGKPSLLWICRSTASSSIQWLSLGRSFSFIHSQNNLFNIGIIGDTHTCSPEQPGRRMADDDDDDDCFVRWAELSWVAWCASSSSSFPYLLLCCCCFTKNLFVPSTNNNKQPPSIHHRHSLRRYRYWWRYAYQVLCLVLSLKFKSTHLSHRCRCRRYGNIRHVPIDPFIAKGGGGGLNMFFWVAGHSKSVTQIDCLFWESKDESQLLCFLFNTCRNPFGPMPNIIKSYRVHGQISRNSTGDDDDDDVAQTVFIIST